MESPKVGPGRPISSIQPCRLPAQRKRQSTGPELRIAGTPAWRLTGVALTAPASQGDLPDVDGEPWIPIRIGSAFLNSHKADRLDEAL